MAVEFVELNILEMLAATEFLHSVNASLKDRFVFAIEKHQPGDLNVVFHLMDRYVGNVKEVKDHTTFMLSAEYILENGAWSTTPTDEKEKENA